MRDVIVICGQMYPPNMLPGARRMQNLLRHLPAHGFRPVIVAHDWSVGVDDSSSPFPVYRLSFGTVCELVGLRPSVPQRAGYTLEGWRRRAAGLLSIFEAFLLEDECQRVARPLITRLGLPQIVRRHRPAAIFSTYNFFVHHIIAAEVRKRWGVPWVADYRDLFALSPFGDLRPGYRSFLHGRYKRSLERKTLAAADAVTTVSPHLAKSEEQLLERPVEVIYNGFDVEQYHSLQRYYAEQPPDAQRPLTLTYLGVIYPGHQNVEQLFAALARSRHRRALRLVVRSPYAALFQQLAEQEGVTDLCDIGTTVPQTEAARLEREADVFVLFDFREPGIVPSKYFNYLLHNKPVLLLPFSADHATPDHLSGLASNWGLGHVCCDAEQFDGVIDKLVERAASEGSVTPYYPEAAVLAYSSEVMSANLASIIGGLL